jgi:hypothetical protein
LAERASILNTHTSGALSFCAALSLRCELLPQSQWQQRESKPVRKTWALPGLDMSGSLLYDFKSLCLQFQHDALARWVHSSGLIQCGLLQSERISQLKSRVPFQRSDDAAMFIEGMRKAGVPE